MPRYRVGIRIVGSIIVEADGPVAATNLARKSVPMLNNKKLQVGVFETSRGEEVEEIVLTPDDVAQRNGTR